MPVSLHQDPSATGPFAFFSRNLWYLVPGLYITALLVVLALTSSQAATAAQMMYRNF